MSNLYTYYLDEVRTKMQKHFSYKNIHQIPKLVKICVNSGLGINGQNRQYLQKAIEEIRTITGQHPIITKSKKAVAGFKIRENVPIGLVVTLRRKKMYAFLEKVIKLVFPRLRDFRGCDQTHFDLHGNFNFGFTEQLVFPELNYEMIDHIRGFNITIVTSAPTQIESAFLLSTLGFPFKK